MHCKFSQMKQCFNANNTRFSKNVSHFLVTFCTHQGFPKTEHLFYIEKKNSYIIYKCIVNFKYTDVTFKVDPKHTVETTIFDSKYTDMQHLSLILNKLILHLKQILNILMLHLKQILNILMQHLQLILNKLMFHLKQILNKLILHLKQILNILMLHLQSILNILICIIYN